MNAKIRNQSHRANRDYPRSLGGRNRGDIMVDWKWSRLFYEIHCDWWLDRIVGYTLASLVIFYFVLSIYYFQREQWLKWKGRR